MKRQINRGFFEKLFIGPDGTVERAQLTEPFAALLAKGQTLRTPEIVTDKDRATAPATSSATESENNNKVSGLQVVLKPAHAKIRRAGCRRS